MADCMYSGRLRQRITVERRIKTKDSLGGESESWQPLDSFVPCEFRRFGAREEQQANRTRPIATAYAIVRYREDAEGEYYYRENDRVVYRGRYYNIVGIVDVDERHRWFELALVEGKLS